MKSQFLTKKKYEINYFHENGYMESSMFRLRYPETNTNVKGGRNTKRKIKKSVILGKDI